MKLIVDVKSDVVVGAHMVGEDAPEIMQGLHTFRYHKTYLRRFRC